MKSLYCIIVVLALLLVGEASGAYAQKAQAIDPELQKLKANLAAAKHDTTRMMAYEGIAKYFQDVQVQNDSSLVYALKAEQLANKYPSYPKVPKVWNRLGMAYHKIYDGTTLPKDRQHYFDQAEKAFNKCIEKAKQLGNEEYLLKGRFNNISICHSLPNKYRFFKNSFESINYLQKKSSWNGIDSLILRYTYKLLCIELDYEIGSNKFNSYLAKYKELTPKEGLDYEHICLVQFDQHARVWKKKDKERLLEEYQTLKKEFKKNFNKDELEEILAQYYFSIQEYEKSFQLMAKYSPQNSDNLNLPFDFMLTPLGIKYMIMGKSAYMLNRNQEAIRYLNKAIGYFNPVENITGMENENYTALLYLGKAYKKAGKYQQALACNEQADIRYKQMHDVGLQALMAENDVQMEEIKQEKKVQAARTQTLLKEQEIEIQKKQKYTFLAISILALLSAAWAVYSFIKTRKQNQIISQQAALLEESNHLKDKIFALLSHDLRSPINRLVVSLNQSIESQRTHIQAELKGVQDILNNVLYWASMQLKKATPVYTNMPLQPLADALIDEYQYALEEKNITFLNGIDKDCLLKTDEGYLKIVLRNLISNAIKFTPNNGYIQIDCNIKENWAQIRLRDTGVGIAKDKLVSLFQLPTPSVGTNQEKGTGLGLSLSLDIVKKLGGSINIQSQEGKGTQVEVALPVAA